jgi:outer membrane lipoprotein-sorting protein
MVHGRRTFVVGALTVAAWTWAHPRLAVADASVADVLDRVTKARASLKTLVAPFTQTRTVGLLATAVTSKGELTLVTPDRLRWELFPPDAATYWITPEGLTVSTGKGSQKAGKGVAGRFGAVLGDLMILIGGDLSKLGARYEFTVPSQKDGVTLIAVPKTDELRKLVQRLELSAGPELWDVRRIVLEEANGDRSVIDFHEPKRNIAVDPKKMQPPAG